MKAYVRVLEAANIPKTSCFASPDSYLTVQIGSEQKQTRIIEQTTNPIWNHDFHIPITNPKNDVIHFIVKRRDEHGSDQNLEKLDFPIGTIQPGEMVSQWYEMRQISPSEFERDSFGVSPPCKIHLTIQIEYEVPHANFSFSGVLPFGYQAHS